MKFSSLASGSKGNSLFVSSQDTNILVDCGLSLKELTKRLLSLKINPHTLNGIIVTHEHEDHIYGVKTLCKTYQIPLYVTEKVFRNDQRLQDISLHQVFFFSPDSIFQVGKISVDSFDVSHDAAQTVGLTLWNGPDSISIVTDLGEYSDYTVSKVEESQALILEANHDEKMLWGCKYPWHIKDRIAGPKGHLGNVLATNFIKDLCRKKKANNSKLKFLGAAHISENGNTEDLALDALRAGIFDNHENPLYFVAKQTQTSELFVL